MERLRALTISFLAGEPGALWALHDWLWEHGPGLFDSDDMQLRELADVVWSRVCDIGARDLTAEEARKSIEAEYPDLAQARKP